MLRDMLGFAIGSLLGGVILVFIGGIGSWLCGGKDSGWKVFLLAILMIMFFYAYFSVGLYFGV